MLLYIVIATHKRYIEARNRLLLSLKDNGWPQERIILSIGDETEEIRSHDNDIEVRLSQNLYEYNAFIAASKWCDGNDAVFLLLHDTCEAFEGFTCKVMEQYHMFIKTSTFDVPHIHWLSASGQANICIFNKLAAKLVSKSLETTQTMDKMEAIRKEWNKGWYDRSIIQTFCPIHTEHMPQQVIYSSGSLRNTLVYKSINLMKYYQHISHSREHLQIP